MCECTYRDSQCGSLPYSRNCCYLHVWSEPRILMHAGTIEEKIDGNIWQQLNCTKWYKMWWKSTSHALCQLQYHLYQASNSRNCQANERTWESPTMNLSSTGMRNGLHHSGHRCKQNYAKLMSWSALVPNQVRFETKGSRLGWVMAAASRSW